jgi:RNA polymerase sigma-70 factor (ECF subfamily)
MSLEAFKVRVLPVKYKLYRFALRITGDQEEAKDIVQEVMIRVWNKRENMDQTTNMEAWCMQITKNLCYDRLKSKAFQTRSSLPEHWQVEDTASTPERKAEMSDIMNQIHRFISTLPDKQKEVIHLRDIEGYSYNEIGEIMGIDINQVKVNLFRARKTIRESLSKINVYGI